MLPFWSILVHWFLKCRCSLLPFLIWPLPICHGSIIPGSYAILLLIASDFTSITSHMHILVLFSLWLHLFFLSGITSPLSSPVAYWAPTNLGSLSFRVISFCLFILFMVFSRQYWSGLPILFPMDHFLSELSTMTRLSWVALHGMAHSFIELDQTVIHVISLVQFSSV